MNPRLVGIAGSTSTLAFAHINTTSLCFQEFCTLSLNVVVAKPGEPYLNLASSRSIHTRSAQSPLFSVNFRGAGVGFAYSHPYLESAAWNNGGFHPYSPDVWNNYFGRNCGSSECIENLVTAPFYPSFPWFWNPVVTTCRKHMVFRAVETT